MGLGKSRHPMKNSRLLLLVRLSFTTLMKHCDFSLLEVSKGLWRLLLVCVAPDFPPVEFSLTFANRGLGLLTCRFLTRIIRGSPDLFPFYTLSRIPLCTFVVQHEFSTWATCACSSIHTPPHTHALPHTSHTLPDADSIWTKLSFCFGGLITLFQLFHTPFKVRKLSSHQRNSKKARSCTLLSPQISFSLSLSSVKVS